MLLFSFSSIFANNIITEPGLGGMNILTYIMCFSPPSQYLIGCFLTQFRYIQYAMQNKDLDPSMITSKEVSPLSSYAAKLPAIILAA